MSSHSVQSVQSSLLRRFCVGDCIELSMGEHCIIRYIGLVDFCSSEMYGIEYIDGTIGEHNGKYKGKKYFIGLPKRCSFIKYNKIRRKSKYYDYKNKKRFPRNAYKSLNYHSNHIFKSKKKQKQKRKSLPPINSRNNKYKKHLKDKNKNKNKRRSSESAAESKKIRKNKNKNKNKIKNNININLATIQKKPNHRRRKSKVYFANKKAKKNKKTKRSKSTVPSLKCIPKLNPKKSVLNYNCDNEYIECSRYLNERIRFSKMNSIELNNKISKINSNKRKNGTVNIKLSQYSLNTYYIPRNILIGDIYIGNRYELKDGRYGICMYVGPLHVINNMDICDNEFIGIALEKGIGRHDGLIRGKRYFSCQRRKGIFIKRNLLWKDCGTVEQWEMDKITTRNIGSLLKIGSIYDDIGYSDVSLSELSAADIEYDIDDDDGYRSGHSGFGSDYSLNNQQNNYDDNISSYIDLFSPSSGLKYADHKHVDDDIDDVLISPIIYSSDTDDDLKTCNVTMTRSIKLQDTKTDGIHKRNTTICIPKQTKSTKKISKKTVHKKKLKPTRQSRSISLDTANNSIHSTSKNHKHDVHDDIDDVLISPIIYSSDTDDALKTCNVTMTRSIKLQGTKTDGIHKRNTTICIPKKISKKTVHKKKLTPTRQSRSISLDTVNNSIHSTTNCKIIKVKRKRRCGLKRNASLQKMINKLGFESENQLRERLSKKKKNKNKTNTKKKKILSASIKNKRSYRTQLNLDKNKKKSLDSHRPKSLKKKKKKKNSKSKDKFNIMISPPSVISNTSVPISSSFIFTSFSSNRSVRISDQI